MNLNLKEPQKTINNSQSAIFPPRNESKPQNSVLELEQSLINTSGLHGGMEKLSNEKTGVSRPILQKWRGSLDVSKSDLVDKMNTVVQQKKTQSIEMRDQNMGMNIEKRVQIVEGISLSNKNNDRKVDGIQVMGKQKENQNSISEYNKMENNKQGKQKIDGEYVKENNTHNPNKQGLEATHFDRTQNKAITDINGAEPIDRTGNGTPREDIGVDGQNRARDEYGGFVGNQIEEEIFLKNKGKQHMNLGQQNPSHINSSSERAPFTSPILNTSSRSLYQTNIQQPLFGPPLATLNHKKSNIGIPWSNNRIGLNSINMGLRNSRENLGMMGNNIPGGSLNNNIVGGNANNNILGNNVKNVMYESNNNHHHMSMLLGGLFDTNHMMIDSQNLMSGGNMSNLNSNSILRRFSTHSNTPVSTLLSSTSNNSGGPPSNSHYQHQPIYHKVPRLVTDSINSNLISKQVANPNKSFINRNTNNNTQTIGNTAQKVGTTKASIQQPRTIPNKDKKNNQPEIIVLDSEEQQQYKPIISQHQNQLSGISTHLKPIINQSDPSKSYQITKPHNIPKSSQLQQINQIKILQTQQPNQIKIPQSQQINHLKSSQLPMASANLYQSSERNFPFNSSELQEKSYLRNYLNKQLMYPGINNTPLLGFSNPHSNILKYYSQLMDYKNHNNQPPQLPLFMNNVNNNSKPSINYSGKQYKQHQYEAANNKHLQKTKQIYKQQRQHHQSDGERGNMYNQDNRMRQLQKQHMAMTEFLSTQAYYPQYNQYSTIIKPQHQTIYQNNYPIINPSRPFPNNIASVNTINNNSINTINNNATMNTTNNNSSINSNKCLMPNSLTFRSSLAQQKQLDILNNIERIKGGFDGLFHNDNQMFPFSNNNQFHQQQQNKLSTTTSQNKNQHPPASQQKPTKPTDTKDPSQANAHKKKNSFYLNSLRQMAQQLQQQINKNTQLQNSISPEQLEKNKIKLQRIKKQLQSADHVKKQAQKAFLKTRSRINTLSANNTKQNDITKKATKKDKLSNKDQDKSVNSQISTNLEEKDKYVFQWTPRLKKLRQVTKKRDFDSVILIGPDFQADIPIFMTDRREIRAVVGVKRASLLKRMFKYSSEVGEKSWII